MNPTFINSAGEKCKVEYQFVIMAEIKVHVTGNSDGAYLHSVMQYGLIFLGNSSQSANIYNVHRKIIRINRRWRIRE